VAAYAVSLEPGPPLERPRPEEAQMTREQYGAVCATIVATQQDGNVTAG
jgi:hypothetical protein